MKCKVCEQPDCNCMAQAAFVLREAIQQAIDSGLVQEMAKSYKDIKAVDQIKYRLAEWKISQQIKESGPDKYIVPTLTTTDPDEDVWTAIGDPVQVGDDEGIYGHIEPTQVEDDDGWLDDADDMDDLL